MTRTLGFALAAFLVPSIANADITMMDRPNPAKTGTTVVIDPLESHPNPETDFVHDDWNAQVFSSGAILFLGSWAASAIVADTTDHEGADRLYTPLVGPWLALAEWGNCNATSIQCGNNADGKILLVADGIFQAAGVLTMIDGLVYPSSHRRVLVADTKVHVTPTGNGVAMFGHF